eukprot:gene53865-52260_t
MGDAGCAEFRALSGAGGGRAGRPQRGEYTQQVR